ncbi:SapB/AmfS family lantipeptide [Microbispora cellulosiformans]|uniref:SapB/AmfS family lantipeptide n=1 Tax=Microbispora cellulosiformans TaxID=2614688 RepID=A0A5J5K173_9ACTN|nr:SapB/AmfS family lanthipeptide [Microbispora cellulosiformans]KAA9377478.1 SapB/AmfS family lantipeptide [Microbispora cellulosiformans]
MALLDLQTLEAPTGGGGGTTGSNLSLLGCTPHENSSLSIICG